MVLNLRAGSRRVRGPRGFRAYAVGDIHGRLDLLEALLARIEQDDSRRPDAATVIVFLGDLIDRGPHSAQVVERLRTYSRAGVRTVFLLGNHEEVMLRVLRGEADLLGDWLRFGGTECIASYGIDPDSLAQCDPQAALDMVRSAIPDDHVRFIEKFADTARFGDYLFVHAGIRPGVPIADQDQKDLRWIRQPFLDDEREHGFVVVHGHTIGRSVDERSNRICLDTGAYRSGILTALGIEGEERWLLQTDSDLDANSVQACVPPDQPLSRSPGS